MFENQVEILSRQRKKRLPNLYMQYRLLHSFWGPSDGPSREYTKTALQMAMGSGYNSFMFNFEFALENELIRQFDTGWSKKYAITSKGVSIHNELELLFSLLTPRRPPSDVHADVDACVKELEGEDGKNEKASDNPLT